MPEHAGGSRLPLVERYERHLIGPCDGKVKRIRRGQLELQITYQVFALFDVAGAHKPHRHPTRAPLIEISKGSGHIPCIQFSDAVRTRDYGSKLSRSKVTQYE